MRFRFLSLLSVIAVLSFPLALGCGGSGRPAVNLDGVGKESPSGDLAAQQKELANLGKDAPKPLPPQIAKAWRDAGFEVRWMKDIPPRPGDFALWGLAREKVEPGAVPAFDFRSVTKCDVAQLPDPGVPFGIDAHCGAMSKAEVKKLAGLTSLQSLHLGGGQRALSDAEMKELGRMKNLQALYLPHTSVTDTGMKELAGLQKLQVLDVSCTQVKDAGMKELARLKNLQALNLSGIEVTDVGLKELAGLKRLRWLNVDDTEVTARGVAALQKELPECRIHK